MKALVKSKSEVGLWLEDVPEPEVSPIDVLIKINKTSICGTDVHIWKWDKWAQKTIPVPMTVGHEFSGTGGQLDYVRGAYKSEGGKSFIAFYSTAEGGEISRIVPRLDPGAVITTPRMDTHYLTTEHGLIDLKGKSTRARALGIIELAHPDFRDELLKAAQEMKIV